MDQRLTSLEIRVAWSGQVADPVTELERVVVPALRRPPCLVSFSGGHDSSLVLAAAARAARRERLPAPIPVTWRVRDAPAAEESA
jgi:asparagine synthase (glutamine-hydrolysing)